MNNTTIEERIFHFRTRHNWSQAQLGEKIEELTGKALGRDVISNYEKGRRKVPSELVPVLARIFGISTDELFYSRGQVSDDDKITKTIVESQELADKDLKSAFNAAIKALREAKREIQQLKDQVKVCENEKEQYQVDAEKAKAVIERVKKNISF